MQRHLLATLLLLPAAAACGDNPTPTLQATVAGLFEDGARLDVGEVLLTTSASAGRITLSGGAEGAEFLYVPFNASDAAGARVALEVSGGGIEPPTGPPTPGLSPAALPGGPAAPVQDWAFHHRLREREIRAVQPRMSAARAALGGRAPLASRSPARAVSAVGDLVTVNASLQACDAPNDRTGRVVAVSDRAVIVEDIENPAGGFSPEEYRNVAATFDTLIYPVDTRNFGEPTDIDENGRVIIFYTRVVNELTEPNSESFVGGFFFGRDLLPRAQCATSNLAEVFYLLAPDPTGAVNNNVRTREFVLRSTLGTVAHEFQHLINAARRIYVNDAEVLEEVWLNEGLSHIAEELQFYAVTGLEPRQNIDAPTLLASEQVRQAFNTYQISNFGRFITYLEEPDTASLMGIDNLPTRGASWAFLRYAADQEPGADQEFFFALVNSQVAGVRNLNQVLEPDAIGLMQRWTVSVYTDDAVPQVAPLYMQPSWNFRSVITRLADAYPLQVNTLAASRTFDLLPGGAAFVRFGVAPGQRAVITTTVGGQVPPERLRVSVVRIR